MFDVHKCVLSFQWFINWAGLVLYRRESEIPCYVCIEDVEYDAGGCCRYSKARQVGQIWESQQGVKAGSRHRLQQLSILNCWQNGTVARWHTSSNYRPQPQPSASLAAIQRSILLYWNSLSQGSFTISQRTAAKESIRLFCIPSWPSFIYEPEIKSKVRLTD